MTFANSKKTWPSPDVLICEGYSLSLSFGMAGFVRTRVNALRFSLTPGGENMLVHTACEALPQAMS